MYKHRNICLYDIIGSLIMFIIGSLIQGEHRHINYYFHLGQYPIECIGVKLTYRADAISKFLLSYRGCAWARHSMANILIK